MGSFWIESTKYEMNFPKIENNVKTEVCIIGAGLFGLTAAYYLAKKGIKVIVIDKEDIGTKTSGNTSAKITSQHGLFYEHLINDYGTDFAKNYLESNENAIQNIKNIIDEENIECDFEWKNNYVYTTNQDEVQEIEKEKRALEKIGFDAKIVTKTDLPFKVKCAIKFENQAQFHPRKYMLGLCKKILENGGEIYTNSKVEDVKNIENGFETYVENKIIKSKYVVLATHYPIINMPGFYFTKMYQSTSYVIVARVPNLKLDGMYINQNPPIYSFKTIKNNGEKFLLVGGSDHKTGEAIENDSNYDNLENKIKQLYPNAEILYKWNTEDCISLDKIPYIGEFSNLIKNMYVGTGFKKWGMTLSNVAANIIVDKILGKDNKYEKIYTSTRLKPLKNRWEMENMIKQSVESLVINKFKIEPEFINKIENDNGAILKIDGENVGIYKDRNGEIYAVNPICSHLGCLLAWNNIDKTWDCPCHGSRFNFKGENLYNPAIKNLERIDIQ